MVLPVCLEQTLQMGASIHGRESITDSEVEDLCIQAVEDLIKSDRRVTLDEIATNLDISHGTVYAIVREKLRFSKVSCRWVPKMLTDDHKMQRLMASRASLRRYRKEGDVFLSRIVTTDWVIMNLNRNDDQWSGSMFLPQ